VIAAPQNKELTLTKPGTVGASQLNSSVRRTSTRAMGAVAGRRHCSYDVVDASAALRLGLAEGCCQPAEARVSFEEAQTAFLDEDALVIDDPDHSETEDRFILLGLSGALRVLFVCHCVREGGSLIRIISARRASRHEQVQYQERLRK
jgi:uncharacterized DUF497 family protein